MTKKDEQWLILAHSYNMDGRASSHTITDKIPLFIESGIDPIILSASTGTKDGRLEHHQFGGWAPSALKFELRHTLRKRYGHGAKMKLIKGLLTLGILPFYALERAFIHLDSHWSWYFPAHKLGMQLIREKKPTLIYSSGGANSAHYAAYLLARDSGLPWIAEVYDPMIHDAWQGTRHAYKRAAKIESLICKHAAAAWWFTEGALENARKRNPELGERGHLIIPGCRKPDFGEATYRKGEHFVMAHFGSLHETRNIKVVLEAMRLLGERRPEFLSEAQLHVYGSQMDNISANAVSSLNLKANTCVHGRLELDPATGKSGRTRVLEAMRQADVLVLLHGQDVVCAEYIPSKLYEYLWTERPILPLTWDNPMLDRMLKERSYTPSRADDIEGVSKNIEALYDQWKKGQLDDMNTTSPYSVENAVSQVLAITKNLK